MITGVSTDYDAAKKMYSEVINNKNFIGGLKLYKLSSDKILPNFGLTGIEPEMEMWNCR